MALMISNDISGLHTVLIVVISVLLVVTLLFAVKWFTLGLWRESNAGRSAVLVNFAVMLLGVAEIFTLVGLDQHGFLKLPAWIILTISVALRTLAMLDGRNPVTGNKIKED